MQFDCSNKTSVVQNNVLLLLLNTERLQLVSDYDLFIALCFLGTIVYGTEST